LISHFVSVELTEPGDLVVESSGFAGKNIEIRPFDYNIPFAADDSRVTIRLDKPGQFVLEAGDRDHVLHIFVNPPFHYEHSDNEIYFGPGIHHPGTISPVSGQTVCFDAGAVVYGHLKLVDVQDVKIVGPGILDSENIPRDPGNNMTNPEYITNSCFVSMNCKNIQVSDVIFRDAPIWAVVVRNNCRNVTFDNVKLIGMWRYNSDGIDICASQDVVIKNSFIRSFDDCFVARGAYLQNETEYGWYLCLDGNQIIGGMGVIENDFHDRKDLSPNVCAVYTEAEYRCKGIAGKLLNMVVEDMKEKGITPIYLVTDHTNFYERYGWEFLCMVQGDGEEEMTRMYIHR
jgi:ribosomal protein S18 acetylase RimI-like enzyme